MLPVSIIVKNIILFSSVLLKSARELASEHPLTPATAAFIANSPRRVEDIVKGADTRVLLVAGPCSVHCENEALKFAEKIADWRPLFNDSIEIVMRYYFEKPRTRGGWKGLVYDPFIDGSNDVRSGLTIARRLMKSISEWGCQLGTSCLTLLRPPTLVISSAEVQ